jgi:hypothetical protein
METMSALVTTLSWFQVLLLAFVLGLVVFTIYLVFGGAGRLMDRLREEGPPGSFERLSRPCCRGNPGGLSLFGLHQR